MPAGKGASMVCTVLVVLLMTALIAGSAAAECAWVLWSETLLTAANLAAQRHDVRPFEAYSTQAECRAALKHLTDSPHTKPAEVQTPAGPALPQTLLTCLPDTVDPRGPKVR